ncbi:hypothetical protein CANARDRAFT_29879 [[Candida] arabinofermentans NRRL YB-2248]|uniref:Fe2OG dioxygenase domain-containing protein n=1 Tax=[Candida] arabinofermentans NRRL YB-2248 TaxID=983967 RepID=A0A1E4SVX8_9ASCO|nr:hypothetical protein CANARDRAFT_29879 [[Candida] arabinofermentans NRRL YB-2248]
MATLQYPYPKAEFGALENYRTAKHTHDVQPKTINLEIKSLLTRLKSKPTFNPNLKFDVSKHIIFKDEYFEKTKIATLSDLHITKTRMKPVSDFAAAYPFPLISQEAADMILWEAFQPEVLDRYGRVPNLSKDITRLDFHVGGHCKDLAPFSNALYTSPEISEIVSKFVGLKVDTLYNTEVGHMNVSLASLDENEIDNLPSAKQDMLAVLEAQNKKKGDEIPSTLGLHYDSNTFALVIMLDMGDDAVGGETGIITGDDKVFRVPDPKIGYATLIQGTVLKHVATKPVSNSNRITGVVGLASAGPELLDNCRYTGVKPSILPRTQHDQFYSEWFEWKFKHLENHLNYQRTLIMEKFEKGEEFDQLAMIDVCKSMEKYLHASWAEMEAVSNPPYPPKEFQTPYSELPDYD